MSKKRRQIYSQNLFPMIANNNKKKNGAMDMKVCKETTSHPFEQKEQIRCLFCGGASCKRCGNTAYLNQKVFMNMSRYAVKLDICIELAAHIHFCRYMYTCKLLHLLMYKC